MTRGRKPTTGNYQTREDLTQAIKAMEAEKVQWRDIGKRTGVSMSTAYGIARATR